MNFTCAFVFEQRSSWAVEMMLAPHRLVVAPPPVVVMHWKRWAFGRDACRSLPSVNAFQNATAAIGSRHISESLSRPSNTMSYLICLYNILFECDSSNKLGGFRLVLNPCTWNRVQAWCISSTLYQSLASVEPIKGPRVGTVPENRMHGMLDVCSTETYDSYVDVCCGLKYGHCQ